MIVKTNVKLNLGLNVLRKRADGFHDIETLFVPCFDFGDTLEIITGDDYSRTSAALFAKYGGKNGHFDKFSAPQETPAGSAGTSTDHCKPANEDGTGAALSGNVTRSEDGRLAQGISEDGKMMITIAREEGVDWNPLKDLCAKAYYILAQDFDLPPVKIFLEKKAPVGAGLGGGSADAAFTLKVLNDLCGLELDAKRLSEYASGLGSDCAFFVHNRPMVGSGRGEVLEPYGIDLSAYEIKVLIPEGIAVSTAEAYKGIVPRERESCLPEIYDRLYHHNHSDGAGRKTDSSLPVSQCTSELNTAPESPVDPAYTSAGMSDLKTVLALSIPEWKGRLVNDFETTVFKAHPELAAIKQSLYDSGAVYASMSGSGSALFALYRK